MGRAADVGTLQRSGRLADTGTRPGREFDPITPPAGTEAVAAQLERATFALFPANGHGVTGRGECQTVMMQAFLADPIAPVDTSCVAGLVGPTWT